MPKILLTNHHLVHYAGSELVTLDIATEFQEQGWNVTVATFRLGGDMERHFYERGIEVSNVLHQSLSKTEFDIVWSHHYPVLIKCLFEDKIKTKVLILSSLSPYEPIEAIPFFNFQSDLILCNSEETKSQIIKDSNFSDFDAKKIFLFKNSVRSNWFENYVNKDNLELNNIAIVSNHPPEELLDVIDIFKTKKINTDLIGILGKRKLVNIDVLTSYDAVITIGRTVQHCMCLGIPVFCYDHFGGPGWLTPENLQRAEWFNYSGRCCYQRFQAEELVDNLMNGFIKNITNISFFRNYAIEHYSLTKNIKTVLDAIGIANIKQKEYVSLNSKQAIGKVGKVYRSILSEREILQKELQRSEFQLCQTLKEFTLSQLQLQDTRRQLEHFQLQLQDTQSKLQQTQSELNNFHQIKAELDSQTLTDEIKNEMSLESQHKDNYIHRENFFSKPEDNYTGSYSLLFCESELPLIDISIVTYNSAKWVDIFFTSLIKQNYPTKLINILITDNNSTDDTSNLCKILLDKFSDSFNSFQIFQRPNLGFGSGHNHNLKNSSSTYFLVTNIDLEFAPDAILQAVKTAIYDNENVASWEFRQKMFEHPKYYNPVTLKTLWSSSACILFKRSAIEKVKGYEEKIFLYGEDVELSYRLRDNGFVLKYCPKAVCWHYTYEEAQQVKPLQFFGSTLANSYLRIRYGSLREIAEIPFMYGRLLLSKNVVKNQKIGLLKNLFKILTNSLYFAMTRKKSKNKFPFRKWDYELIRDGAFYKYSQDKHEITPLVSVIIRTYEGRLSFLKQAVTSVLNQTYTNIELIVVEDGSKSATEYLGLENIRSNNVKIKYLPQPKLGRCGVGNAGLANATGEFLIFLDDDDLFFAEHLEILVNQLLTHPEVAAAYSTAWEVKTKIISTQPLSYEEISHDTIYRQPFSRALMWHHNYIPIQSILFRRKLYDCYGGFDEELDCLEDWNLWTRYCMEDDFLFIEKTTSLYRVPFDETVNLARQQKMDSYYSIAANKQKELSLTLSPLDVIKLHEELNSYQTTNILINNWKSRLRNNPIFMNIYKIFKKQFLL